MTPRARAAAVVLIAFLLLSAAFSWPLLRLRGTHIAGDPFDPVLNASILWWTATTVPLSQQWWNPPYFYPTKNVMAFSENLLGISPLAGPAYWITGNPLTAYNIALYLTWPLSGFALYLLVRFLTRREDAAIIAGLAFGFSPYRTHELGHIQMMSSYWIPLVFLGLHGFVTSRRKGWLLLFACTWVLQSLANMYMLLFCGLFIVIWLAYFCSVRVTWRAGVAILATWILASAALAPVLMKYRQTHHEYGLSRSLTEPLGFSLPPGAWLEVSRHSVLWHRFLLDHENLFPGAVAPALVVLALIIGLLRSRHVSAGQKRSGLVSALPWIALMASAAVAVVTMIAGPWRVSVAGLTLRVSDADRAIFVAAAAAVLLLARSPGLRSALARRDPWLFYTASIGFFALCAYGPIVRVGRMVVFEHGPYWWLMQLPGFDGLRVPFRIWMLGVLCLSVSAGYAFASFRFRSANTRVLASALVCLALVIDTWATIPMAAVTASPQEIAALQGSRPLIELPLGPAYDAAATFRSIGHGRPVVNGVSGYDPAHYAPLQDGLADRDPLVLLALSSFAPLDIAIKRDADGASELESYVSQVPGITAVSATSPWQVYRLPRSGAFDGTLGDSLPVRSVRAYNGDARAIIDGRSDTFWRDLPQRNGQWIVADLGDVRLVGGISHAMGDAARDFPRRLAIDLSVDGNHWTQVFDSPMAGWAVRSAILSATNAEMRIAFAAQDARYVRLRQTASHRNYWILTELSVHAPPAQQ
jgi:hypothetical protein